MPFEERKIVYREQMDTADLDGNVKREIMQACYIKVMVDESTGEKIPTNKMGIVDIPLAKYPRLKAKVEDFVPDFIAAFEQEYQEEQERTIAANQQILDQTPENSLPESTGESLTGHQ